MFLQLLGIVFLICKTASETTTVPLPTTDFPADLPTYFPADSSTDFSTDFLTAIPVIYGSPNSNCTGSKGSSLTYLVDTTGSMYDDLAQLKLVNTWLLDRVTARLSCGVYQYTMVEFNDPTVGPVRITYSKNQFDDFFQNLVASGGGDCPELTMAGLKLALQNSPSGSLILVLTDASAKDYNNVALVNEIYSLLNSTRSQVLFLTTGLCGSMTDPDYLIFRDIASRSFGHVFNVDVSNLNIVFNYLDYTLSKPANSSKQLFSKDYSGESHSDSFSVSDNFTSLIVTTDGVITSFDIIGPGATEADIRTIANETWGSMYIVNHPVKGIWTIEIAGPDRFSVRIEGFHATNVSSTSNCSKCHPKATCDDYFGYYQCSCNDGFVGDGFNCSDIDECAYYWSNKCGPYTCENTYGSYTCSCPTGYYNSSEYGCVDINECASSALNSCESPATCINSLGSYTCVCPYGYVGNGTSCEVDECTHNVCDSGMDCIKRVGSYSCYDPCLNYTALDDAWRSTSSSGSYYYCDYDKNGWYRFEGRGGVKMPEFCVTYACGSPCPMWLSGSHPRASDGIVNRTACASWYGSCCTWSSTVQIKACPDKYYVYKLHGTPTCSLTYCTDVSSVTDVCACANTEECSMVDGEYGCNCKDEFKISDISDIHPNLTCGKHEMKVSFLKCQLKSQHIDVNTISIAANRSCYTLQDDIVNGTYSITIPLYDGQCGVTVKKTKTFATYFNTMYISLNSNDTAGPQEVIVDMKCSYPLNIQLSLDTAFNPMVSTVHIVTEGTGQFSLSIALFQDGNYTTPYQQPVVQLSSKAYLYIGISLDGPDASQYAVLMTNCFGTPTKNIDDPTKFYIIKDSCPNKQDSSISVPMNGVSDEGRFSLQLFKFITGYNTIYLHCEINLCDFTTSVCEPACNDSRNFNIKSKSIESFIYNVSIGPVQMMPDTPVLTLSSSCVSASYCLHLLATLLIVGSFLQLPHL
ncbi:uromodulin-like isoform X2 [Hyperolius riggenbachi]|uniref:uromodulin-like isoform X2 n=1 Tax=Hyperolius riggenbachi TaxID=752182 RepID=UPI0035A3ADD0